MDQTLQSNTVKPDFLAQYNIIVESFEPKYSLAAYVVQTMNQDFNPAFILELTLQLCFPFVTF